MQSKEPTVRKQKLKVASCCLGSSYNHSLHAAMHNRMSIRESANACKLPMLFRARAKLPAGREYYSARNIVLCVTFCRKKTQNSVQRDANLPDSHQVS